MRNKTTSRPRPSDPHTPPSTHGPSSHSRRPVRWKLHCGLIVVVNVIEVVLSIAAGGGPWNFSSQCSFGLNLSVFRTLRLLRLLYTIPSSSLRELLGIFLRMADSTVAVVLIFALFLYTFTLLGTGAFGGRLDRCLECSPLPRPLDLPLSSSAIEPRTVSAWHREPQVWP